MSIPIHSIRKQYLKGALLERQMDKDPVVQLGAWLSDAIHEQCPEPTAMALSTVGQDLRPSSRMVLMKHLDEAGITFFTHYDSRKGLQIGQNPHVSLLFFWPQLERQVRIEGMASKVSETESDEYFSSRPEASRISASISPQSQQISGRDWLEERWRVALKTWPTEGVSRPLNWGGYRVFPDYFEFWQGRPERLHDRIAYQSQDTGWRIFRLAP
jgi:pyridoxamine 5'-phosphate oxidase